MDGSASRCLRESTSRLLLMLWEAPRAFTASPVRWSYVRTSRPSTISAVTLAYRVVRIKSGRFWLLTRSRLLVTARVGRGQRNFTASDRSLPELKAASGLCLGNAGGTPGRATGGIGR